MKSLFKKLAFLFAAVLILSGCNAIEKAYNNTQNKIEERIQTEEVKNTPLKAGFTEATVLNVVDGDTIDVEIDGEKKRVRFVLVNTPESVHPRKPVEYYGKEASAYTTHELDGKTVYLEKDVSDTDRYGRLLRYIWIDIPEGKDLEKDLREKCFNAKLLLQGYASLSTFPPDIKYVDYFRTFEKSAREASLGLWGEEGKDFKEEEKEDIKVSDSAKDSEEACFLFGNGTKFHLKKDCVKNNEGREMTVKEAMNMGYTPCKKCAKKYLN